MGFCIGKFIGRLLFVAIFILAGIDKLQNPAKSSGFLVSRLEMLENLVVKHHNITLPEPCKLSEFKPHADNFIKGVGVYLIVAGVGTLFAYRVANCLIGTFVFMTIVVVHNPLYKFGDSAQAKRELNQFILNMALWGVSMFMCGQCSSACSTNNAQKKKQKSQKEADPQVSTTASDNSNKKGKKKSKRD